MNYYLETSQSVSSSQPLLQGNLEDIKPCKLFYEIYSSAISGILSIDNGWEAKNIYFYNGKITQAESNIIDERLSRILVKESIITEEMRLKMLKFMAENSCTKEEEALLKLGYLNHSKLENALKLQIEHKLVDLFNWKKGKYIFITQELENNNDRFSIDVKEIIYKGIKKYYTLEQLKILLIGIKNLPITKVNIEEDIHKFFIKEEESKIYQLIDGTKSIETIISLSKIEPIVVYKVIYLLYLFEAIQAIELTELLEKRLESLEKLLNFSTSSIPTK